VPVVGFSLGYPDESIAARDRLPLRGVIHSEVYRDYGEQRIESIYKERDIKGWERYTTIPELKEKVEASGVKNLAQIYTHLKYTQESHIKYSEDVLSYLKKQGFFNHDTPEKKARRKKPSSPQRDVVNHTLNRLKSLVA
jgi:hypothetical protein